MAAQDPPDVNRDIVIVELNDTTIRDLDPAFGRWPWPRAAMSLLVDFLNRAPAKVIALDFAFTEGDRVLLHQLGTTELSGSRIGRRARRRRSSAAPGTILLADATYEGLQSGETGEQAGGMEGRTVSPRRRHLRTAHDHDAVSRAVRRGLGSRRTTTPCSIRAADRFAGSRRSSGWAIAYMPSLGVAAALRGLGVRPRRSCSKADTLRLRDRLVPLLSAQIADASIVRGTTERAVDDAGELPGAGGAAER